MIRMLRRGTTFWLGAAVAYFADPDSGQQRRRKALERFGRAESSDSERSSWPPTEPAARPRSVETGRDTATGTDPAARYTEPGYQDVSFGQATARDAELADRLMTEAGDAETAERRFDVEATGAPVLRSQ